MTKQKIENKLCEYLNCTEVLWIKDDIDPQETTAKEAINLAKDYSTNILYHMVEVANTQQNTLLTEIAKNQKDK